LVPATLRDSLMARLDRLSTAKETAQRASVIGRETAFALLQAVSPGDAETLRGALRRLVAAGPPAPQGARGRAPLPLNHRPVPGARVRLALRAPPAADPRRRGPGARPGLPRRGGGAARDLRPPPDRGRHGGGGGGPLVPGRPARLRSLRPRRGRRPLPPRARPA